MNILFLFLSPAYYQANRKKKTWFSNENVYQFIFIQQNEQNLELKRSRRNRFVSINWPCFLKD